MKLEERVNAKVAEALATIEENRRHKKTDTKLMRDFEHNGVVVTIWFTDVSDK